MLRTCREFLRECSELKLPEPTFLNGILIFHGDILLLEQQISITEGVTVISEETNGQLMDTFDNVEQEEFFEVNHSVLNKYLCHCQIGLIKNCCTVVIKGLG